MKNLSRSDKFDFTFMVLVIISTILVTAFIGWLVYSTWLTFSTFVFFWFFLYLCRDIWMMLDIFHMRWFDTKKENK